MADMLNLGLVLLGLPVLSVIALNAVDVFLESLRGGD